MRAELLPVAAVNMLEWYDFAVYGFLAEVIGKVMFPARTAAASLLLSVAGFGVGFLTRPLGSVVFGVLADRKGRKYAVTSTLVLMGTATLTVGVIPPFTRIGMAAPVVVVIARLLQGFGAGGAMGGTTALLTEHAPAGQVGYFGSWQAAGQAGALLLGAMISATVSATVTVQQFAVWGWRLPFLASALFVPLGLLVRSHVHESRVFLLTRRTGSSTLSMLWNRERGSVARGFGITILWTVATYFFYVYVPLYARTELHISTSAALFSNSLALGVILLLSLVAGRISDRLGRNRLMVAASICTAALITPGFWLLLRHPSPVSLAIFQVSFSMLSAFFVGPAPGAMSELFPTEVRSSGIGIAYGCAVTLFGGFAPLISAGLLARTGDPLSPTWYVMFSFVLSLLTWLVKPQTISSDPSETGRADS